MISKVWKKIRGVTATASGKIPENNHASKCKENCLKPYRYVYELTILNPRKFHIKWKNCKT
jgi:hypothetical protein